MEVMFSIFLTILFSLLFIKKDTFMIFREEDKIIRNEECNECNENVFIWHI